MQSTITESGKLYFTTVGNNSALSRISLYWIPFGPHLSSSFEHEWKHVSSGPVFLFQLVQLASSRCALINEEMFGNRDRLLLLRPAESLSSAYSVDEWKPSSPTVVKPLHIDFSGCCGYTNSSALPYLEMAATAEVKCKRWNQRVRCAKQ